MSEHVDTRIDLSRATAAGRQLIEIHDHHLRDRLDEVVAQTAAYADGAGPAPAPPPASLRQHCLSFCSALDRHHTGEDAEVFPALRAAHPEPAETILRLEQDHRMLDGMTSRLADLVTRVGAETDPALVRALSGEVGQLAALMESHFAFEERQIVSALDQLGRPPTP